MKMKQNNLSLVFYLFYFIFKTVKHDTDSEGFCHKTPPSLLDRLSLCQEEKVDSCAEAELIKSFCCGFSKPGAFWIIVNISTKLDKLYFTVDTFIELATFIPCTEEDVNSLLVASNIGVKWPVRLKRLGCQTLSPVSSMLGKGNRPLCPLHNSMWPFPKWLLLPGWHHTASTD